MIYNKFIFMDGLVINMAKKYNRYERYDKALIDRIDSIKSDGDFDPYQATKKRTVSDQEMFDDELYNQYSDTEENNSNDSVIAGLVIAIGVIILGCIIYGIIIAI